jgi:hypothetical protein
MGEEIDVHAASSTYGLVHMGWYGRDVIEHIRALSKLS